MGLDLQFRGWALPLEVSAADSLPGAHYVWETDALDFNFAGSAPRRARPGRGSFRTPQEAHAHPAGIVCLHGAKASLSFCHGRWTKAEVALLFCARWHFGSRPANAQALGRAGNGRRAVAAVRARRSGELCGDADGQGASEPELHRSE